MKGRVQKNRPAEVPGVSRRADGSAVLLQVVYDLIALVERALPEGPTPLRGDARTLAFKLRAAFPDRFTVTETDLAQHFAEEDGDAIED